jgi:hypothetical protein
MTARGDFELVSSAPRVEGNLMEDEQLLSNSLPISNLHRNGKD